MESTTSNIPRSRSRGSIPNLNKLNIAPLSSNYPLEPSDLSPEEPGTVTPHASYLQGKGAPTTPGILSLSQSRSSSRTRRHRNSRPDLANDGYFLFDETPTTPPDDENPSLFARAKSTTALLSPILTLRTQPSDPNNATRAKKYHKRSKTTANTISPDWIHRAGIAIASSTRDQKGQTWLASRDSSTSLASPTAYAGPSSNEPNGTVTPRARAHRSLPGSRLPSAYPSRRGSRVGSKTDVVGMTASGTQTPTALTMLSAFEPDFVNPEDESEDASDTNDEAEVSRLTREQTLGLGGWVDWLVGRTLFRVNEDGEENDSETEEEEEDHEMLRRKHVLSAERRRRELDAITAASAGAAAKAKQREIRPIEAPQEEGGWKDAAWLLSVASKIIL